MSEGAGSRTVLVTGVSRGLGQALAVEFARLGHTVYGCARSRDAVRDLEDRLGDPHRFASVDVCDAEAVSDWLEAYSGPSLPDLAVMNAGVANRTASLWDVAPAEIRGTVATAVEGVANIVRALVPGMLVRGRGVLVATSSGLGVSAARGMAPYCAAKWALEGLMQALALDLPSGLAAVTFDPGMVDTPMLRGYLGDRARGFESPESWAPEAAAALLSLDARSNGTRVALGPTAARNEGLSSRLLARLRRRT